VNPDAEIDVLIRRETCVRLGQSSLRLHRTLHGFNRTPKFGKDTVARRVRYAASVLANKLVEDRAPFGQALERADLISPIRRL
jgi:hypothetical protein